MTTEDTMLDDLERILNAETDSAPARTIAPQLPGAYAAFASLRDRHGDAMIRKREAEELIFDLEQKLRRARENLDYETRREVGIRRRLIAGRAAIRAHEDDQDGLF